MTATTEMETVPWSESLPSRTTYPNESDPAKSRCGMNVKPPSGWTVTVPLLGALSSSADKTSSSMSPSLDSNPGAAMVRATSSVAT